MLSSTTMIVKNDLNQHIIRDCDLNYLFQGSAAKRYALVNKALKKGELIRICRGFYIVADKYQQDKFSRYYLANRIVANSFITAESALSFHGWIPEAVTQVISVTAFGRNREYQTPMGRFIYKRLPIKDAQFYFGVNGEQINQQHIYVASPLRALMDYMYWHKINNAGYDFLQTSLRIEPENIHQLQASDIMSMMTVYKSSYAVKFLKNLLKEVCKT